MIFFSRVKGNFVGRNGNSGIFSLRGKRFLYWQPQTRARDQRQSRILREAGSPNFPKDLGEPQPISKLGRCPFPILPKLNSKGKRVVSKILKVPIFICLNLLKNAVHDWSNAIFARFEPILPEIKIDDSYEGLPDILDVIPSALLSHLLTGKVSIAREICLIRKRFLEHLDSNWITRLVRFDKYISCAYRQGLVICDLSPPVNAKGIGIQA